MSSRILATVASLSLAAAAHATPLEFTVNPAQSNVNVQLCLSGSCDTDPSSVSGSMSAKTLPVPAPANITLYDFFFHLNDQIDLQINIPFGAFTATGTNVSLIYATPGNPQPSAPIAANSFSIPQVPTDQSGILNYNATGLACLAFQSQEPPIPCVDSIDLSQQGTADGDINGTSGVVARTITLTLQPNFSLPIDPANPDFGALTITGTIVAVTTAPLRGDANLNGTVNALDIQHFINVMLVPGDASSNQRFAVNMNDDDVFDELDVASFVNCLLGNGCPA